MTVTAAPETVIPAGTWRIDPSHSALEFSIRHLGIATVKGRATGFAGEIAGGEAPSLSGVVSVASLTTFDETRDAHLQAPDFFDAERHPELRFVSTAIESRNGALVVSGTLTIKGISREVDLHGVLTGPETDPWENARIGLELTGVIDRTDFDLRWNAPLPGGGFLLADEVRLDASLSAVEVN